ncbi:MFS transporter [Frankia sp. AgB1.9]|uniref:MFS transporter n=1 Tax=unclassified Frankia TaxID=2632575 RepID=UPI001933868D|nr:MULTISPECIES: MFS transporter [unclassified Frankia]MBL7492875.1 MFS transporter [Frankia sp. AgW1.1]MBL7551224.1 MFS transporter [Frankia sp. AgB1.9]MBL7622760.1 MFS transporter [Frankia sp. AgB1.8]
MGRKWWALGGVAVAVFVVGLDGTVLSVALPVLAPRLHGSATDLVWFSSAYLLTWAAAMLPLGSLGDRYGRRRVMIGSLAAFGATSAWAAWSGSAGMFIAARAVGGIAGAGIVVMAMSAVTVMFTEEERPRAVGVWAGVNFLALPTGPILGGWLLDRFWWGWVFLINVPVVVIALVAVVMLVPESRAPRQGRLDLVGMVLFGAGLAGLVYGFAEAGTRGWASAVVIAALAAGTVLLTAFAVRQRPSTPGPATTAATTTTPASVRVREPLVDVSLFRIPEYVWGTVLAFLCSLAMIGLLFTLPQYFQAVLGVDSIGSGLRLLPLLGGLAVGAAGAEPLAKAISAKAVLAGGFAVMGAGLMVGAATDMSSGLGFLSLWTPITGVGIGLVIATATAAALGRIPVARAGTASALIQALQDAGSPFGAAVLGTAALASYRGHLDTTGLTAAQARVARGGVFDGAALADQVRSPALLAGVRSAFVNGVDTALLLCGGIAFAGALLALLVFPRRATIASSAAPAVESHADEPLASSLVPRQSGVAQPGAAATIEPARGDAVGDGSA